MNVSDQLREIRQRHGFTQEEIATKLFITRQSVSRWETGKTTPPLSALQDLSELYGVHMSTLLGEHSMIKKRINLLAVFGSIMFNLLFLSTFGVVILSFWLSAWFIDITFVASPAILLVINTSGLQAFAWDQTIYSTILFIVGIVGFIPLKKISIFLFQSVKHYYHYTIDSFTYTID